MIVYLQNKLYYIIIYTLLYREEKQKQAEGKEEREQGRMMPPTSSQVPRLSSAPSDASTVHTIASRSPLPALLSALRDRDGRPPRPLLGDAIATTSPQHRHRSTSSQRPHGSASTFCHHARLVHVLFHHSGDEDRAEQTKQKEREPGRRMPPLSSPVHRLSSVCCPHRPRHRPFFPSVFVCGSCYSSP